MFCMINQIRVSLKKKCQQIISYYFLCVSCQVLQLFFIQGCFCIRVESCGVVFFGFGFSFGGYRVIYIIRVGVDNNIFNVVVVYVIVESGISFFFYGRC